MIVVHCPLWELGHRREAPLYMCFIDLAKVYDSVDRAFLCGPYCSAWDPSHNAGGIPPVPPRDAHVYKTRRRQVVTRVLRLTRPSTRRYSSAHAGQHLQDRGILNVAPTHPCRDTDAMADMMGIESAVSCCALKRVFWWPARVMPTCESCGRRKR